MRRVAREEESPVPHRLAHVAAHAGHALLDDRSLGERPTVESEAELELLPDAIVRPLRKLLVGTALDVETAQLW